jgi:hypothetical protein
MVDKKHSTSDPYIEGLINEKNRLNGHEPEANLVTAPRSVTLGQLWTFAIVLVGSTWAVATFDITQRSTTNERLNLLVVAVEKQNCLSKYFFEYIATKAIYRGQCEDVVKAK